MSVDPAALTEVQRLAGNTAATLMVHRDANATPAIQSEEPVKPVPWTGDPVTMAGAMTKLLLTQDLDRIADSLGML